MCGPTSSDKRATAIVVVVEGGRPRQGSVYSARGEQEHFGRPDAELIEAGAGTTGMLHGFTRIGSGVSAVWATSGTVRLTRVG
jgi:hypothetical protein